MYFVDDDSKADNDTQYDHESDNDMDLFEDKLFNPKGGKSIIYYIYIF